MVVLMQINNIQPITFGYSSVLKDAFRDGKIKIKKDITGKPINKKNATLDHTIPRARGGKSKLENYSIMSIEANVIRGIDKLGKYINLASLLDYIIEMMNVDLESLNGIDYLKQWLPNLRKEVDDEED